MRPLFPALAVTVCVVAGTACDEKLSTIAGPTPDLEPTFSSIQQNIFEASDPTGRLACTQCHTNQGGRNPSGRMNLEHDQAYAALVGTSSVEKPGVLRVAPGDPEASYLVHKLEGRADIVGVRMPRGNGPFLTEGQISIIRRWIELGARND
jgi:hypothetical protein